jgi:hypothetical protein
VILNEHQRSISVPKHLVHQYGAGVFYSGTLVYLCAYQQRKIIFDKVYGWEVVTFTDDPKWWVGYRIVVGCMSWVS